MEEISKDSEILEKLVILHSKLTLTFEGAVSSDVVPSFKQRERLVEQLDDITAMTDRFIKNLILLLENSI